MGRIYFHLLPGRFRLQVPNLKGNYQLGETLEKQLNSLSGIVQAKANPSTGTTLIFFRETELKYTDIIIAIDTVVKNKRNIGDGQDSMGKTFARNERTQHVRNETVVGRIMNNAAKHTREHSLQAQIYPPAYKKLLSLSSIVLAAMVWFITGNIQRSLIMLVAGVPAAINMGTHTAYGAALVKAKDKGIYVIIVCLQEQST